MPRWDAMSRVCTLELLLPTDNLAICGLCAMASARWALRSAGMALGSTASTCRHCPSASKDSLLRRPGACTWIFSPILSRTRVS